MQNTKRLNSWKEIAIYLGCDVSTAQRWEKERSLPVRRVPGGKRQNVFAWAEELDTWLGATKGIAQVSPARKPRSRIFWLAAFSIVIVSVGSYWITPRNSTNPASEKDPFPRIKLPSPPAAIAVADLNRDGKLDLIVGSYPGRVISVVLGDGTGGAASVEGFDACDGARTVASADFDGDGNPDVAVGCNDENEVVLFWGDRTGHLANPTRVPLPGSSGTTLTGDVNGDGHPDLVCVGSSELFVLISHRRSFTLVDRHPVSSLLNNAAMGDFNRDGKLDLMVSSPSSGNDNQLVRYDGVGNGKFLEVQRLKTGQGAGPIALADFNGDGFLDLALGTNLELEIYLGSSSGFHLDHVIPQTTKANRHLVAAEMNSDLHPDLVTGDRSGETVRILYGDGRGSFSVAHVFTVGRPVTYVVTGDLDKDGKLDIVGSLVFDNELALILGRSHGT